MDLLTQEAFPYERTEHLKHQALFVLSQRFSSGLVTTIPLTITFSQDLYLQDICDFIHSLGSIGPVLESKSMERGVSVNLISRTT